MANIKSAKKRIKTNETARIRNKSQKSSMRTTMKKLESEIANGNKKESLKLMDLVSKKLDKAVSKKVVHKNFAARNKAKYMNQINNI